MRNKRKIVCAAVAAGLMMAVAACGSPKSADPTTSADTTAVETTEATTAETTSAADTTTAEETSSEDATDTAAKSDSGSEAEAGAGTIAAGQTDASGKFTAASGAYEIVPPAGWTADPSSDEKIVTFVSPDETAYIEITSVTGKVDSYVEKMPESVDEYKRMVSREGEDFKISDYNVSSTENGQAYQYKIRYNNEDNGMVYYAISCSYDTKDGYYLSVDATVETGGDDVIQSVQNAMDTFKVLK